MSILFHKKWSLQKKNFQLKKSLKLNYYQAEVFSESPSIVFLPKTDEKIFRSKTYYSNERENSRQSLLTFSSEGPAWLTNRPLPSGFC